MKQIFLLLVILSVTIPSFGQDKLPERQADGSLKSTPVNADEEDDIDSDLLGWIQFMEYGDIWSDRLAKKIEQLEAIQRKLNEGKRRQDSTLVDSLWLSYRDYSARLDTTTFQEFAPLAQLDYDSRLTLPGQSIDSVEVYLNNADNGILRDKQTGTAYPITHVSSHQVQIGSVGNPLPGRTIPVVFTRVRQNGKVQIFKNINDRFQISTLRMITQ